MTELAQWLQACMQERGYTQIQTAVHTGVSQGTISGILKKKHVPRIETLFRLADHFDMDRIEILQLAGHLQTAENIPRGQRPQPDDRDYLVEELVEEFAKVPDEWKPAVIQQVELVVQMANQPPMRFIGDEDEPEEKENSRAQDTTPQTTTQPT